MNVLYKATMVNDIKFTNSSYLDNMQWQGMNN